MIELCNEVPVRPTIVDLDGLRVIWLEALPSKADTGIHNCISQRMKRLQTTEVQASCGSGKYSARQNLADGDVIAECPV